MPLLHHVATRRAALRSMVGGSMLLPALVSRLLAEGGAADPLAPKKPHFTPKAKRVIFLFSTGGVSHLDTFDPKPKLFAADGRRPYSISYARPTRAESSALTAMRRAANAFAWACTNGSFIR